MKLACIISAFDGTEFLDEAMSLVAPHVSLFIIARQEVSYSFNPIAQRDADRIEYCRQKYGAIDLLYTPKKDGRQLSAGQHESFKRSTAVKLAENNGATHYFYMDCDELYPDFEALKNEYIDSKKVASCVKIAVYFKRRDLRIEGYEQGIVCPLISKISAGASPYGWSGYPYTADPTRLPYTKDVFMLSSGCLHHLSWVREDDQSIRSKAANSSSACYIKRSTLLQQYLDPNTDVGTFIDHYAAHLQKA